MNIQEYKGLQNVKGSMQSFKSVPAIPKHYIPEPIGNVGKIVGEYINVPEQKLFLATSALLLHPLIDLKFADEDKKVDSAIKSAAKAFAGGLTGVTIRALFISLAEHCIGHDKHNIINTHFYPKKLDEMMQVPSKIPVANLMLKKYNKTLGTLFAVLFMILFSNSKLDVPITSDLQDLISGVVKDKKTWKKSMYDVSTSRKEKIVKWMKDKQSKINVIIDKVKKISDVIKEKPDKKSEGKAK
ncbi:hypothetical protein II906_03050 [bacterium]|nr:hypothetical protein [bacterium]